MAEQAPGPRGLPLLGSVLDMYRDTFHTMLGWQRRYGDVVRYRLGPRTFFMVGHPKLAEDVLIARQDRFIKIYDHEQPKGLALVLGQGLVTSSGALWQKQRRLIQPMFHRSRVAGFGGEIAAAGLAVADRWAALPPGEGVDVDAEMMRATLDIITRTMFSTSVLDRVNELSPALTTVLAYAGQNLRNPLLPPLWVPTPGNRAFRKALACLDDLVYGLIRQRRQTGERHDDLLDTLLHADGGKMDERQIRDEVLTVFIAGHETTAVTLTWTWYLLAGHPKAATRLRAELDGVPGDGAPAADDLPRIPFTRAVIEEALRLYPPAIGVIRKAAGDTELGGFPVPAGSLVLVDIANIHRNAEFWPEPDDFRPERFLEASPAHRLAFMPFGAGPRVCVGAQFAMAEAEMLLAILARRYRLELLPETRAEPDIVLTLRPRGGLRLGVFPRNRA